MAGAGRPWRHNDRPSNWGQSGGLPVEPRGRVTTPLSIDPGYPAIRGSTLSVSSRKLRPLIGAAIR